MKENQRVTLTKRLIREGLLRLVEIKPLDKISISELCKESGVNRATFYRHYAEPHDVLLDIEQELIQALHLKEQKPMNLQDFTRCAENMLEYFYKHSDLLKVLLQYRTDEEIMRAINELYEAMYQAKSKVKGMDDLDEDSTKLLSAFSVGGIYYLLRQWILTGMQKTPAEISQLIIRFLDKNLYV